MTRSPARPRLRAGAKPGHHVPVLTEAFSPDGRTLFTRFGGGEVIVWDLRQGRPSDSRDHGDSVWIQAFSPDGRTLYTAGDDSSVMIWDVAGDHRLGRSFRINTLDKTRGYYPAGFAISPDGRTLAVARFDGRVDLIDAATLRRTDGFEAFAGRSALAIEYSPDGRRLAVAGAGGGVGVWDAESGTRVSQLLRVPDGPAAHPHNVRASPSVEGAWSPRPTWEARCGSGTSKDRDGWVGHCIWGSESRGWPSAPTARSSRSRSVGCGRQSPTASRSVTPKRRAARQVALRPSGPARWPFPRRSPARRGPGRWQHSRLDDRRLASGGTAADSRPGRDGAGAPGARLLPGRPHACHLPPRRHGRALGRRVAAADRLAASGPAGRRDDGTLHNRR